MKSIFSTMCFICDSVHGSSSHLVEILETQVEENQIEKKMQFEPERKEHTVLRASVKVCGLEVVF